MCKKAGRYEKHTTKVLNLMAMEAQAWNRPYIKNYRVECSEEGNMGSKHR